MLHISDPHAQNEVMIRLRNLAHFFPDCDVLALTSDCTSTLTAQLDDSLNDWPQKKNFPFPAITILPTLLITYLAGIIAHRGHF
jgi:hypothetical protein